MFTLNNEAICQFC